MLSNEQKNTRYVKIPEYKRWIKCISEDNKAKINEILAIWEDVQDFINNNLLD
jgi:hypothetical protein